jgi:hypothetical protein
LYATSIKNLPNTYGTACIPGSNCLTALGTGGVDNNKEALLILAGPALTGVPSPRTGAIGQYFEDQNVDGNALEFKSARRTKTFNDHLVIVSP